MHVIGEDNAVFPEFAQFQLPTAQLLKNPQGVEANKAPPTQALPF